MMHKAAVGGVLPNAQQGGAILKSVTHLENAGHQGLTAAACIIPTLQARNSKATHDVHQHRATQPPAAVSATAAAAAAAPATAAAAVTAEGYQGGQQRKHTAQPTQKQLHRPHQKPVGSRSLLLHLLLLLRLGLYLQTAMAVVLLLLLRAMPQAVAAIVAYGVQPHLRLMHLLLVRGLITAAVPAAELLLPTSLPLLLLKLMVHVLAHAIAAAAVVGAVAVCMAAVANSILLLLLLQELVCLLLRKAAEGQAVDTPGVLPQLLLQHGTPRPHKAAAEPSQYARFAATTALVAAAAALPGCIAAGAEVAAAVVAAAQRGKVQVQHLQCDTRCRTEHNCPNGGMQVVACQVCSRSWAPSGIPSEMAWVVHCLHAAAVLEGMREVCLYTCTETHCDWVRDCFQAVTWALHLALEKSSQDVIPQYHAMYVAAASGSGF